MPKEESSNSKAPNRVISSQPGTTGAADWGHTTFFWPDFQRKGSSYVHSAFAGVLSHGTRSLVSQPHPQLTRAGVLRANSLQVLHKCLFFQPQRELCFAVLEPRSVSS